MKNSITWKYTIQDPWTLVNDLANFPWMSVKLKESTLGYKFFFRSNGHNNNRSLWEIDQKIDYFYHI